MPQALFLIGANTGCTKALMRTLQEKREVVGLWQIASGSYDVVALVRGGDLTDLFNFKEGLGALRIKDATQEGPRPLVDHVSFNIVFPNEAQEQGAVIISSPKRLC